MSNDAGPQHRQCWEIAGFIAIAALMAWDLGIDYTEGAGWAPIASELAILVIALIGAALNWHQLVMAMRWLGVGREEARQWCEENRLGVLPLAHHVAADMMRALESTPENQTDLAPAAAPLQIEVIL